MTMVTTKQDLRQVSWWRHHSCVRREALERELAMLQRKLAAAPRYCRNSAAVRAVSKTLKADIADRQRVLAAVSSLEQEAERILGDR